MFSKMPRIASRLQPQFQLGEVAKEYVARVHGRPLWKNFHSDAAISAEPQQAGARSVEPHGLPARTEFEIAAICPGGKEALVLARPITGRTNQICIHL